MIKTIQLLLPALVPSWRFFDIIAPSPRIEFTVLKSKNDAQQEWGEFRPRPLKLSVSTMLKRIIWNPHWNESLFLTSCAERIIEGQDDHSIDEIISRIRNDLTNKNNDTRDRPYLQFRLVVITRENNDIKQHVAYISPIETYKNRVQK